jgi:Flp pilus assembly protein TadG
MIRNEKGQATVELAFALIILVLFLFAIVDFGRIFHAYLTLEHAGREAARLASLGAADSEVVERIISSSPSLNHQEMTISISPSQEKRTRGTYVTVNLSYPMSFSIPILQDIARNKLTLDSKTVMRVE